MKESLVKPMSLLSLCMAAALLLLVQSSRPVWASSRFETIFESHVKALRLIGAMQATLLAVSAAERGAVMAVTDEDSEELAAEARRSATELERLKRELQAVLVERNWTAETALLDEFDRNWQESRQLDAEILDLAARNTNLKAARLSQGRGIELLRALDRALAELHDRMATPTANAAPSAVACQILVAARMIQILHAPHIAEAESDKMDGIEQEIRVLDAEIRSALEILRQPAAPEELAQIRTITNIYEEYAQLTREVMDASRQNTNVRSLALSMGQKRKVTACCQEILQSLKDLLNKREFKGTR